MSLRNRLSLLLALFGVYAVLAAAVAIFGSHMRVERAAGEFQQIAGQTTRIEELELHLTEQTFLLKSLAAGHAEALAPYTSARKKWNVTLQQCARFAPMLSESDAWRQLYVSAEEFERQSNEFLKLMDEGDTREAKLFLRNHVEADLLPALRGRLKTLKSRLSDARNRSARELASTTSQVLTLTVGVALLAAVLVLGGGALVRRWLMRPISRLHAAAAQFREGNLDYRSQTGSRDELGELGAALNEMAGALAATDRKHRTMFANLRDAVVICDREATVLEYHDGDTEILGVEEHDHVGRPLLDVWPEWRGAVKDWQQVIRSAVDDGRRLRVHDVQLVSATSDRDGRYADFVVYRVDCLTKQCAAIVVRDATDRHQLQERLRHAETMEAVGTMAGGLAHDVNNLLSSVTGSLSSLANDLPDAKHKERIDVALRGCRRAAGLTKRLLNFARGIQGSPQTFSPAEVIDTIFDSMDAAAMQNLTVERALDPTVRVHMDQDQFAQIVMNLFRNARDASSEGGRIEVRLEQSRARHPGEPGAERPFAVLAVKDHGSGMTPEIENRAFEPFFTTKARTGARGRGMGLPIVYAAAKSAGGFVRVESERDVGTCVSVYLPMCGQPEGAPSAASDATALPSS